MPSRRHLAWMFAAAAALAAGSWSGPAGAAPAMAADRFVDGFGQRAVSALNGTMNDRAARRARFEELLRDGMDMPKIAALVLGRAWRAADADQRGRFTQAFEDHLIETYTRRFDAYAGERLQVLGQTVAGDDVLVASRVVSRQGEPVDVVWRVRAEDDRWRIIDASVAGVSMVVTWRNEFGSVIEADGLDGLIARLQSAAGQRQASTN